MMTEESETSRFDCPSRKLDPHRLVSKGRKLVGLWFLAALVTHLSLGWVRASSARAQAPKPLTTQFVKRQPRLTKPLELKKRPQPKRRHVQRTMVSVQARPEGQRRAGAFHPSQVLKGVARPGVAVGRAPSFQAAVLEPEAAAQMIQVSRETEDMVNMSLEMVDIRALDTGKYQALVIQDPNDRRNLKGFFHMARLRSPSIDYVAPISLVWTEWIKNNSMVRIAETVNRYTDIQTDYRDTFTLDDRKLLSVPLVMLMPASPFEATDSESQNIGVYLASGGLLFEDWGYTKQLDSVHQLVAGALVAQGVARTEWEAGVLPDDHPLFHCFFDFDGAPPGHRAHSGGIPNIADPVVKGVILDGRVLAIISEWWYTFAWGAYGVDASARGLGAALDGRDAGPSLRFAVNLVVFALTQEGSITSRVMDSVSY